VKYSVDYKLPLMKKMFKKMMPKSYTVYYSEDAYRVEFLNSFSFLGIKGKMEGFHVDNYNKLKSLDVLSMIVEKAEKEKDTTEYIVKDILVDTISKISYTGEKKTISNSECVGFIVENNESRITGFLTTEFSAIGAIIDGKNYGLPMYLEEYDKKEKVTEILRIESVRIEPLEESYYSIE